jgi:hypothetical protein
MQMKIKYLVPILLIVFIVSFTACKTTTTAETTVAATLAAATTVASEVTQPAETTTPETTTQPVQENADYNIGDTGPAGGFIFYINPNYKKDGWKYLEAAPGDFPGDNNDYYIPWYNGNYVETGATETAIGTGKANTQKIVDIQSNGSYAAKLCTDLTQGGYSDWFMPSSYELDLMYKNLYSKGIGSFESTGSYWSSSEIDASHAWVEYFLKSNQNGFNVNKNFNGGRVRTVRAFN